jgi:hypothetical protein
VTGGGVVVVDGDDPAPLGDGGRGAVDQEGQHNDRVCG